MAYNPYSPYPANPYGQPMYGFPQPNQYLPPNPPQPQPQQQQQENLYAFVNGVEGAKSYQLRPNQSVMLMDSEQPLCYMKTANAMGQATLRYFRLTEIPEADARGVSTPQKDSSAYVTKTEFEALAKKVDELSKPVPRPTRRAVPQEEPQGE